VHEAGEGEDHLAGAGAAERASAAELDEDGARLGVFGEGLHDGADARGVGAVLEAVHVADGRACAGAFSSAGHRGLPSVALSAVSYQLSAGVVSWGRK
jgi:hypothetical protein